MFVVHRLAQLYTLLAKVKFTYWACGWSTWSDSYRLLDRCCIEVLTWAELLAWPERVSRFFLSHNFPVTSARLLRWSTTLQIPILWCLSGYPDGCCRLPSSTRSFRWLFDDRGCIVLRLLSCCLSSLICKSMHLLSKIIHITFAITLQFCNLRFELQYLIFCSRIFLSLFQVNQAVLRAWLFAS